MAVRTACPYCGVGCGLLADVQDGKVSIKGDPDHPANFGRLCSKGSALGETVGLEERILAPLTYGEITSWDDAVSLTAQKFKQAIQDHGPDSVAIYASGQILTEDYYVANKLMKGFIGSANIDTNSRLCMASTVAGHIRAFGSDTVPGVYEDLELADLVVLVGSNLAWCHPVLFQRLAAAKKARPELTIVNIDPRRTVTSELADLHLSIAPGGDVALFSGLLVHLAEQGMVNSDYVEAHVSGFDAALTAARDVDLSLTGLTPEELERFYNLWSRTDKTVTVFSQGVNQAIDGTDKVNTILNAHLATGRIGRPGMGPFSVTGQPNAMGGREVGGLATMLAAHLNFGNAQHALALRQFWDAPNLADKPGLKAVELFDACLEGRIKALWIISTNPAVSLPEADRVKRAIEACDFVAVSDVTAETDTAKLADVLFPAAGWGEKSGTVTNSERRITRQRSFLPLPGDARPDWQIICDVAKAMGWQSAFDFQSAEEIFQEHIALTHLSGKMGRDLNLEGLSNVSYDEMEPTQWPVSQLKSGGRFFADGGFFTPDRKANMVAVQMRPMAQMRTEDFPFRLNTGRVRDHWHTMTRTAKSPRLSQHLAEPYIELCAADAAQHKIAPAELVLVESLEGSAVLRALISDGIQPGSVFVPMHWTSQFTGAGRIGAVIRRDVDPTSGQPASKASVARISPFPAAWYGFALTRERLTPDTGYWASSRIASGWKTELAALKEPDDWEAFARELLGLKSGKMLSALDEARGSVRLAFQTEAGLQAVLYASREPVHLSRSFVASAFSEGESPASVLAGRPGANRVDPGQTICSCFDVGINTIVHAIENQQLMDVDAIGKALQAGTNCGSCKPELQALLQRTQLPVAAE